MLLIHGRANSVNVQKVLWTCVELGVAFERRDVGGAFGGNDTPEYLAKNPNGLVPTVEDGDAVLWESNAIVRYLGAKYNRNGFLPDDLAERAQSDRWMDWQLSAFWPPLIPVFINLVRTPPEKRDSEVVARGVAATAKFAGILNDQLADRKFLCGDRLTVGDIPVGGIVHRWLKLDIERPDHPHLEAYYRRLGERPGYREHVVTPLT